MSKVDERRQLHISPENGSGVTVGMVSAVRDQIERAGGTLAVWAVLGEDDYETFCGDGFFLILCGVALNPDDARRLADLAGDDGSTDWHIRPYQLAIDNGYPKLITNWPIEEEFSTDKFVELVASIPPNETASKLYLDQGMKSARRLSLTDVK